MKRRTLPHLLRTIAVALFFAATVPGCMAPRPHPPAASVIPSRDTDTSPEGFYYQPAGLADDYPEESTTLEKIRLDFEVVRATGARHFRFAIGWDGVEVAKGQYEWGFWDDLVRLASMHGVTLLPYVCYTPAWANSDPADYWRTPPDDLRRFGDFMYVIASRYKGKIASWELWNEPDIKHYWTGTASQFAEMVRWGARQVRRADPAAVLVLGGMARGRSAFLEELLREHRLGEEFDVVNVHGYFETWTPEPAEGYPRMLQEVRDLIDDTAPHLDLWLAEFGYSDYRLDCDSVSEWVDLTYRYEHTPRYQAVSLWKHHVLVAASGDVSLTTWYRIHDLPEAEGVIGDANNRHLGILDVDSDPKPACAAFRLYHRIFDHPYRAAMVDVVRPQSSQSEVHVFRENDGHWIITAWLRTPKGGESIGPAGWAQDPRTETISVRLPLDRPARWQTYRINGTPDRSGNLPAGGTFADIRLTGGTVFIAEIVPAD